jgi:hypothetical protein
VIFGIPKGGDGSVEQAYRYPKGTWTREQAAVHCGSHGGQFEASLEAIFGGDGSLELVYMASVHSIETGQEKNLATFYLMNTSRNRMKWGVTKKALEEALPTLLKKPMGIGPDYKFDKHYGNPLTTGTFVSVDQPDGYALGKVEFTDPKAWDMLQRGDLGPISVVISSYREVCSQCGTLLTGGEDPFNHECIKKGDAFIQVESFKFKRVDFVDVPAYPQAGLLNIAASGQVDEIPIELLAGFYTSQSLDNLNGRGVGSPGLSHPQTRVKTRKIPTMSEMTPEEMKTKIDELTASFEDLKKEKEDLEKERNDLKADLERLEKKPEEKDPEFEAVKTELAAIKKRIHDELVDAAVEARFAAGLIAKKDEEKERIAELSDEYLRLLAGDALKIAEKLESVTSPGPKTRYAKKDTDELSAAIESEREKLYGYRRDANGNLENGLVS